MYRLICFLLLIVSIRSFAQDCSSFKKGNFAYRDSAGVTWNIKRTATHQTETNSSTKYKVRHRIQWTDSCTYKLTQQWASTKAGRKYNGSSLTYIIVSTTENTYSFSCTCHDTRKISGVVARVYW